MGRDPGYERFGRRMRRLVDEHHQLMRDQEVAAKVAERNERARRQFLEFLLFFILATSIILREEINNAAADLYAKIAGDQSPDARQVALVKATRKVDDINKIAKERLASLSEIAPGLGEDVTVRDSSSPTNNARDSLRAAKRRQAVAMEIQEQLR